MPIKVFISPSVVYNHQIISRGKKVKLKWIKRSFKENATYNINFGNSIVDFHEKHTQNFTYFFSTGDKIDSFGNYRQSCERSH